MSRRLLALAIISAFCGAIQCSAQCRVPETIEYPAPYNGLVCEADAASRRGDDKLALDLLLRAAKTPLLEAPNVLLYGRIAQAYANLGQFKDADKYLRYDELSLLWRIGIVRCQTIEHTDNEGLFQDGRALDSEDSKHMANELCGEAYSDLFDFRNGRIEDFLPAAKAILRHEATKQEIEVLRAKKPKKKD